jgi:hypothetical protein
MGFICCRNFRLAQFTLSLLLGILIFSITTVWVAIPKEEEVPKSEDDLGHPWVRAPHWVNVPWVVRKSQGPIKRWHDTRHKQQQHVYDDFGTSCQLDSKVGLDPLKNPFGISIKYSWPSIELRIKELWPLQYNNVKLSANQTLSFFKMGLAYNESTPRIL